MIDQDELDEQAVKECLKKYPKHLAYWALGYLIYEQNPYFPKDVPPELALLNAALELDAHSPNVEMNGRLRRNTVDNPFCKLDQDKHVVPKDTPNIPKPHIPKPPSAGGPTDPPITYYWQRGVQTHEETDDKDGALGLRRNVVKEIEIRYGPPIHEEGKIKPPHIIILYAGGNN